MAARLPVYRIAPSLTCHGTLFTNYQLLSANQSYHEQEILRRITGGDEQAFELLYRHYRNKAYAIALTYMSAPAQAEDVLQEFFLKLWRRRETLQEIEQFENYLFIALRNTLISELRKQERQAKIREQLNRETMWQPTAEELTETREMQRAIRQAIQQLPEKQQRIYKMSREEGLNHAEIAELLQLSRRTVSNTITLILNHLRNILKEQGYLPEVVIAASAFFY